MINRMFKGADKVMDWFLGLVMTVMLVVVSLQVWYRFVLNDPLAWSEELARYLFVWISFIGSAVGVRMNVHLGIDLIEKIMTPRGHKILSVIVNALIQIFLLIVIFWGIKILAVVRFQTSASMGIPMTYPYLAVPVGGALMLINSLRNTWALVFNQDSNPEESAA
jgi:TRAP-type C4-dicarboxylate transport system permease small subunit